MRPLRVLLARIGASLRMLAGWRREDGDLRAELESHLEMHIEENVRRGMAPEEARRQALVDAGGLTYAAESTRAQRGLPSLENLAADVRYAARGLRSKPEYCAAVVLTLALGIGANSAMFTIVNAVVLRPLPYPAPEQIVSLSTADDGQDVGVVDDPDYQAWLRDASSLTIAAYGASDVVVMTEAGPREIHGMDVALNYFSIFSVRPLVGRSFAPSDYDASGPAVMMLGERYWRSAFKADTSIIGRSILVDDTPTTVIGVVPASFVTVRPILFWRPYRIEPVATPRAIPGVRAVVSVRYRFVVGRLRDGVSIQSARSELESITRRVDQDGQMPRRVAPVLMTLHDRRYGEHRKPLLLLFGAVGVLLLVACANLASLAMARATGRQREIAVRLALGASRWRVVRGLLCESVLLSLIGAGIGLGLGIVAVRYFVRLSPDSVGNAPDIGVDVMVLVFTTAIAVATGIAFGVAPAASAARGNLQDVLSNGSPRSAGSSRQRRVRRLLVVAQLATALVLLTGFGLVARSFWTVTSIDIGVRPEHLLAVRMDLPSARYSQPAADAYFAQLLQRVVALPGVEAAGYAEAPPLMGGATTVSVDSTGHRTPPTEIVNVGPDYFRTIGARLLEGRGIDSSDRPGSPPAVVINSTYARRLFADRPAAGKSLTLGSRQLRIVGVVADVAQREFEGKHSPAVYHALAQEGMGRYLRLVVRTKGDPRLIEADVSRIAQSIDRALPPPPFTLISDIVAERVAPRRFTFTLLGIFALVAASLAVVGLYSVLAYLVAERTREIGIRVALGADPRRVTWLVISNGFALASIGTVVGLAVSTLSVRAIRSLVYGTSIYDPWTFAASTMLLVAVSAVASYVPARRASRVDPAIALRAE
ncbi:MAG TPA: ABC transporter permease [Gemmatimonadaceae bacterium]|nr:ABC transporter permease [Gemmatimonadaceae bacterium]